MRRDRPPPRTRPARLIADPRGAVAVEMAMTLPLLLVLIMGIIAYGDWFLVAHSVQQTANDAARAAIGGLTAAERQQIATSSAQTDMQRGGVLDPGHAAFTLSDDGTTMVFRIRYDVSADPLLHLGFVPMPGTAIARTAAIRLDGL